MAELFVSKVLAMLALNIHSQMEQEYRIVVGVEKELEMLKSNLEAIKVVLVDAEKKQVKDETIRLWLAKLKSVSYDIDDVLEEWSTAILKFQIEREDGAFKRKVLWPFILSSCFLNHDVFFRHDIAMKIKELNERLDVIAKEKDRYGLSLARDNEQVERIITTSFVDIKDVKGRENDKHVLMDLLLSDSSEMPNPHVISLVEMGGIGKTTLAKLVFNEDRVKSHFHRRIWIVSDPFDEIRIAKAILESLAESASNFVELQSIVQEIQKYIESMRFLLVLDDVWNQDATKWERVEQFLKCGSRGSKILVTTRKENVARIMGCRDIIRPGLLSSDDCWSMFSQIVFSTSSTEHYKSLEGIGRKIVDKCKGLPLAVKTMAGLLRFKESIGEWQSVLNSEMWELEEVERDVLAPLLLSYHDLSSSLKQCFLHCVTFPKDYKMNKKILIEMWMSQGYLKATKSKDMETVGDDYFQNLAMRSFFQDFEENDDSGDMYCKMHDIVHDFAQFVMKNKECCSIDFNDPRVLERIDFNNNEMRHVRVMFRQKVPLPSSFYNLTKLRSLVVSSTRHSMIGVALPHIFNELTRLRLLSLSDCGIEEIPSNINKLIHLRQLDFSYNARLEKLPETICKLYNLQTLNLYSCKRLKWLPVGMGNLINLRCLHNEKCKRCLLPKGIGRLSDLRRLGRIDIGELGEAYLSLRDVKNFNHLGGILRIFWRRQHERDVEVEEAKEAKLKEKRNLSYLGIWFSHEGGAEWRKEQDEELLEALEPSPTNLKSLEIWNYEGIRSCSWITGSMNILKKIVLYKWRYCEELPTSLGKLHFLESLEMWYFKSLKKVEIEDHDDEVAFPNLIDLKFHCMDEWEEWNILDKSSSMRIFNERVIEIMPSLRSLTLFCCPKLKALPNYIFHKATLKLDIQWCESLPTERIH